MNTKPIDPSASVKELLAQLRTELVEATQGDGAARYGAYQAAAATVDAIEARLVSVQRSLSFYYHATNDLGFGDPEIRARAELQLDLDGSEEARYALEDCLGVKPLDAKQ